MKAQSMADKQTAFPPTASGLRRKARMILDQVKVTANREKRRRLAMRAFELVQLAEQLTQDKEQRQI
jgi:hypothetical protein